jgi:hypothetical protein
VSSKHQTISVWILFIVTEVNYKKYKLYYIFWMLWLLQLIPLLSRIHKVTLATHHTIPSKKPITKTTSNQSFIIEPLNVVKAKNKNMLFILYTILLFILYNIRKMIKKIIRNHIWVKKENPEAIEQQKDFSFFTSSSKWPTSRSNSRKI